MKRISHEMARLLKTCRAAAIEAAWPKAGTPENAAARQAQTQGLLSVLPIRKDWCRFEATAAGRQALESYEAAARGGWR